MHRKAGNSSYWGGAGDRRVEVADPDGGVITVAARHAVVIVTGSTAAMPPIRGLRGLAPAARNLRVIGSQDPIAIGASCQHNARKA